MPQWPYRPARPLIPSSSPQDDMGFIPHNSEQFFATFYDSGPNPWSSYPTNEPDIFSPFESHAGLTSGVPSTSTSASPGFLPVHVAASLDCAFLWNHEVSQDDTLFHPFMSYAPSLPTDGGAVYEFSSSSPSYVDGHSSGPGFFSEPTAKQSPPITACTAEPSTVPHGRLSARYERTSSV